MTCNEVRARLDDYIDGLMIENERIELETHIEKCEACANELAQLELLLAMLNQVAKNDGNELPNQLHQKLCDIPNTHKSKKINIKLWGTLAAGIICAFVLMSINPTGLALKKELVQDNIIKDAVPEMSADENMMGILEEDGEAKAEAKAEAKDEEELIQERAPMQEYGEVMANEIYIEIDGDLQTSTNMLVEEMQNLKIELGVQELGKVELIEIDEESFALIIEKLGKIGDITYQPESLIDSILTIYLIEN